MADKINKDDLAQFILNDPDATISSLAREFNVSVNCIYRYINKYNINYKRKIRGSRKNYEIKSTIEKCIQENPEMSLDAIGKLLGKTRQGIWNHIINYKIDYKKKVRKSSINKEALEKYISENPNANLDDIGISLNKTTASISNFIRNHKINYDLKKRRIDKDKLQKFIQENPYLNQANLAKEFGVTQSYISYFINKHNLKYKR